MHIIVPLAGPDYFQGSIPKGLEPAFDGSPQLYHTLNSRIWSENKSNEYTFILYDCDSSRDFAKRYLSEWFVSSNFIFLSKYTEGAALSAISAICFHKLAKDDPLIFDLADIYFETEYFPDFENKFFDTSFLSYSFKSNKEIYSYYQIEDEKIIYAAEKKVISNHASAGVYIYKNAATFLESFAYILSSPNSVLFNNLLFLAPIVNGLIEQGKIARSINVSKIIDYKILDSKK